MEMLEPSSIIDSVGKFDSIVGDTAPLPPPKSPFSYLTIISLRTSISIPSIPDALPPLFFKSFTVALNVCNILFNKAMSSGVATPFLILSPISCRIDSTFLFSNKFKTSSTGVSIASCIISVYSPVSLFFNLITDISILLLK